MARAVDFPRQPTRPTSAVLDASVLVPFTLRGLILEAAEQRAFRPLWSEPILDEVRGVLLGKKMVRPGGWRHLESTLRREFPQAVVPTADVRRLEPAMTNDPKDRHVLAAAVAAGSGVVVTNNLRDFRPRDLAPHRVAAVHPDAFLVGLLEETPEAVRRALTGHVNGMRTQARWSEAQVLGHLKGLGRGQAIAPRFATRAERVFGIRAVPPPARDGPRLDLSRSSRGLPPSHGLSSRTPERGRMGI